MNQFSENLIDHTIPLVPGIRAFPIVHGSLEYTVLIRKLLLSTPPALLAVELPENISESISRVLPHADQIPIITINDPDHPRHLIMEPLEPLVEAVRSAYELSIPFHLIDSDNVLFQSWIPDFFPDTYILNYLNAAELYELYKNNKPEYKNDLFLLVEQIDFLREIFMSVRLRNLSRIIHTDDEEKLNILLICGIRHLSGLKNLLQMSDDEFNTKAALLNKLDDKLDDNHSDDAEPLEAFMREENSEKKEDYELSVLSRESPEVLEQPGYFNTAWNLTRNNERALAVFNRVMLQRSAYRDAVNRYERESSELVPPQREKLFFRFARNWSIIEKKLLPNAYRMVISARGFGNDNFARIMYDTLFYLPPLHGSAFPEKRLTLEDLHRDSRLIRFRMKLKIKRKVPPPNILRRFKKERYPGEWRDAWSGSGICSYPPEDIQVEDFGHYLQTRAKALMQSSENKTVPFSSSLLDGIDYRETVRNLHLGKIFVKDICARGIDAGSVVIIFSEDEDIHNWRVVWWGEHDQESDMALYATPPGQQVVGPGISRCIYGGFMLTFPPGRLHDIWEDDFYSEFNNSADRLLAAAIEYNDKNAVVHLSERPPNPRLIAIAGRMGQKIIHIPLSIINPIKLGRVRRFHVLDSRERRNDADDYIW